MIIALSRPAMFAVPGVRKQQAFAVTFDLFRQPEMLERLPVDVRRPNVLEAFLPEELSRLGFFTGLSSAGAARVGRRAR